MDVGLPVVSVSLAHADNLGNVLNGRDPHGLETTHEVALARVLSYL